jgi:hypothetical protein
MCLVALSFICVAVDSVMIHFPRKRCLSVSTTHEIRARDRGAKKFGSLKYFESVASTRRNLENRMGSIKPIGTVIYPKKN